MASNEQLKLISERLVELLSNLMATGNWEASLFLRTAYSKLEDLQRQAAALAKQLESKKNNIEEEWEARKKQGYIPVYVSIYQSDSYNLVKWENTLKSIKEYSINRPIYRSEDHINETIRSKQSPNEGYVSIFIQQSDIIPPYVGKMIEDKWGHELLTLRDNSFVPDNIIEFVHQSRRFLFKNGKLFLKSENK